MVDVAFSAPLTDRFRLVPALTKVLGANIMASSSVEAGGDGGWEATEVEIWEEVDEENCLDGRRRRLMWRGMRATREVGGEGERGEAREDGLSFVVEKALLLVVVAVWTVVFLRFVCLGRAIPLQRRAATLSFSPRFQIDFFTESPPILSVHRSANRSEESERARIIFVGDFCSSLLDSTACSTLFPSHKQLKTTGTTERT